MPEFKHISVLHDEAISALNIKPGGVYADATLGGAGHAATIAEKLTTGRLYGIDRDMEAIEAARERLAPYEDRVTLIKSDFRFITGALKEAGPLDGVLFDLGVSSHQLDEPERGFSYMTDAPLDMRMDRDAPKTAYEVVNSTPRAELAGIIYRYGEERYSRKIAAAIERSRQKKPVETTLELASIVASAVPNAKKERQHPAKRTFQAIRIAVNDELSAVETAVEDAVGLLAPGGRIVVITFHSLEDRIVKHIFKRLSTGCTCPPEFPVCVCGKKPVVKLINSHPVIPGEEELKNNPRSRSAKLRAAEKLSLE